MTGAGFLGAGVPFGILGAECDGRMAADFPRAAEAVAERLEFLGESGVTDRPFPDWTFHRVSEARWIARLETHRKGEALYLEWNPHRGAWDDERVQSNVDCLAEDPTKPALRVRPRATQPGAKS